MNTDDSNTPFTRGLKNVSNLAVYIIKFIWSNKFNQINLTVY